MQLARDASVSDSEGNEFSPRGSPRPSHDTSDDGGIAISIGQTDRMASAAAGGAASGVSVVVGVGNQPPPPIHRPKQRAHDSSIMLQHIVLEAGAGAFDVSIKVSSDGRDGGVWRKGSGVGHSPDGQIAPGMTNFFTDALAMACRFLPDAELQALIQRLIRAASRAGSISAIVLTGLCPAVLPLLQSYIDRTADVQTAVLLCAHGPPSLLQHSRFTRWRKLYSQMLNSWQLYHARW